MPNPLGQQEVVVGGSLAGLMTARVLADYFETVTVLERDHIESFPAQRKSTPQGNDIHALLHGGRQAMVSLYPDLAERLDEACSVRCVFGQELVLYGPFGKAYSFTGSAHQPHDFGIVLYQQSRLLLEYCVRQSTLNFDNVIYRDECAA